MSFQNEWGVSSSALSIVATKPISTEPPLTSPVVYISHHPNESNTSDPIQDELSFEIERTYSEKVNACINPCV